MSLDEVQRMEQAQTVKVAADDNEEIEPPLPVQQFKFYLKHEHTYKIMSTNWQPYTFIAFFGWFYELCWTISGVNNFTDITRTVKCGSPAGTFSTDPAEIAASTAVYDAAICICAIWHMAEWIRWTLLWTTSLVNVNLVPAFYVLSAIDIPLGFIIALYGFITTFSAPVGCGESQPERSRYLFLQILCFFVYFILSMSPFLYFKIQGVDKLHADFLKEDDEEEED